MKQSKQVILWRVTRGAQVFSMVCVALVAVASVALTLLFIAGLVPWPTLFVGLGEGTGVNIAPALVLTPGIMAVLFLAYMPTNWRMIALENSHRRFQVGMEDVANAYWAVHEADRSGAFNIKSEYDSVKERILFLRDHPELGHLEPEILELAAEMSHTSRDLAVRYSDEAIERARNFLAERMEETERLESQIETALSATRELKQAAQDVDMQEAMLSSRVSQLLEDLNKVLPDLGFEPVQQGSGDARRDVIMLSSHSRIAAE